MCKISFFYVGILTFYSAAVQLRHVTGEVAKNTAELCSEALVSTAACHKTFAFSPLIPKQMIADPQTWEEQLVQITSSE